MWQQPLSHFSAYIASRRRSGDTFTSIGNALINMQLQQVAISNVFKLPYHLLERLQATEGDDHVIMLPLCLVTAARVQAYCPMHHMPERWQVPSVGV